ncbi:DEAD/DEAH box helicase [Adhaeretor mobilis]|uniref:DEAD/DEAH box helicase n=1 Tax=Adhaeretor mobilis TaxID=1930276 RepID=UPI001FE75935|nr:DEAD/DEAH box helicase [Adhaeretor mobilis]
MTTPVETNVKTSNASPTNESHGTAFSQLGLAEQFLRATKELGYETATPIQARAIPLVLAGQDLIGCAQTGTGKTAAFTLPMLDRLMQTLPAKTQNEQEPARTVDSRTGKNKGRRPRGARPKPRPLRALILSPTRELAAQIEESLKRYGKHTPLRQTVVYGGVGQHSQVKAMRHGVDALVATPGRLLDLMNQGHIDLSRVEILVFDEADQMLDMGFLPDLKRIVSKVPEQRQTLMFSATMPDAIRKLAQQWLKNPEAVQVAAVAAPAERIAQSVHLVDKKRKPDFLTHFLCETARGRTLVFSRTKHGADKLVRRLIKDGLRAAAIHGDKSQGARSRALAQFKSKNPPVLIATDIAARGLDIDDVSHVVNYDLPETPETYVHRIGRTARAGAEGVAVSFCAGDERGLLKQIERLTKRSIAVEPTIEGFEPTDPITQPAKRGQRGRSGGGGRGKPGGNGYRGKSGARNGSGSRPTGKAGGNKKRFGAKSAGAKPSGGSSKPSTGERSRSESTGTATAPAQKPRRQKGSTEPPANYKGKNKRKGRPTDGSSTKASGKRRRPSKG